MNDPRLPASRPITRPSRQVLRAGFRRRTPCWRACGRPLEPWDDIVLHGNKLAHRLCAQGFEAALDEARAALAELDHKMAEEAECPTTPTTPTPSLPLLSRPPCTSEDSDRRLLVPGR